MGGNLSSADNQTIRLENEPNCLKDHGLERAFRGLLFTDFLICQKNGEENLQFRGV